MNTVIIRQSLSKSTMSRSIAERDSETEMETVCGMDVPTSIAEQLREENKRRDDELEDLLNDYIMLNSVTLTATDRR